MDTEQIIDKKAKYWKRKNNKRREWKSIFSKEVRRSLINFFFRRKRLS